MQSRTVHIPFGQATISIVVKDPSSEWHLRLCGAMKVAAIGLKGGLPQLMHEEWFLSSQACEQCPVPHEHLKDMMQARNCAKELLNSQSLKCFEDIGKVHVLVVFAACPCMSTGPCHVECIGFMCCLVSCAGCLVQFL